MAPALIKLRNTPRLCAKASRFVVISNQNLIVPDAPLLLRKQNQAPCFLGDRRSIFSFAMY